MGQKLIYYFDKVRDYSVILFRGGLFSNPKFECARGLSQTGLSFRLTFYNELHAVCQLENLES